MSDASNTRNLQYNAEQQRVVDHTLGPMRAIAVAGSGKTAAVVGRIIALIRKGVDPSRILAMTFSRRAAREMNERLRRELRGVPCRVGTFHSVALQILKSEIPQYESWTIAEAKYRLCIKMAVGYGEMEWKEADITVLEAFISRCFCALVTPEDGRLEDMAQALYQKRRKPDSIPRKLIQAYTRAEEIRKSQNLLTFDAMLTEAAIMLRDQKDVRDRWASRWDYVIADEYQDSNPAQITVAEALAVHHRNYCGVGDPGQTIFTWRGAEPAALVHFDRTWPDAKTVVMNRNYRCGRSIIALANKVLDGMDPAQRLPVSMVAERALEGVITATEHEDFDNEAQAIVSRVVSEQGSRKHREFAVLYRTQAQSRALEEAFLAARVPYVMPGGTNFYERSEVSDLLAYLRLAAGKGDSSDVTRCLNKPFRFLGKAFLHRVELEAEKPIRRTWTEVVRTVLDEPGIQSRQRDSALSWCALIDEVARRLAAFNPESLVNATTDDGTPAGLLELILARTGYADWLRKEEGDETVENSRLSNVRELVRVSTKFRSVREFLGFIDETIAKAKQAAKLDEDVDAVTFITIHGSKGLEWPVVFVIGLNEGILPHARSDDHEEERRLLYVAVTRARDELHLSCVDRAVVGGKVRQLSPSPFLIEAGVQIEVPNANPVKLDQPVTIEPPKVLQLGAAAPMAIFEGGDDDDDGEMN
jgi:DNA helicase-2/ATP-dependent DNA helicase PcrA